jgi:translation initiation factor 2 beta subunit (eIF-2beta)/eIF-5
MAQPDYLLCLECESPTYLFEWDAGRVLEAQCAVCGNDEPGAFATEEEMEEMSSDQWESEAE